MFQISYGMFLLAMLMWIVPLMLTELAARGYSDPGTQIATVIGCFMGAWSMWKARFV